MLIRPKTLTAMVLILVACGEDDGPAPADSIDAGPSFDAEIIPCSDASDCIGEPFAKICAQLRCVECLIPADCAGPGTLGPDCDTASGECRCDSDADCSDNRNGPVCNQIVRACGCVSDQDCPDPRECEVEPYLGSGVRTCQPS